MSDEIGFERGDLESRIQQIVEAVGLNIDTGRLNMDLPQGIEWDFHTIDTRVGKTGRIVIEGERMHDDDDDGVEIVVQIKHVTYGPHRLVFEEESESTVLQEGSDHE